MASTSELDRVTLIVMRFMRLPIIVLVLVYAVGVSGMALIPGQDEQGNTTYMNLFHAFYFFTYTATTTGFGEIPTAFTDEQRLWAIVCLYGGVIAWLYAIGSIIRVMQNPYFLQALSERRFARAVRRIGQPYYVICGFGDTGSLLARGLSDNLLRAVVIDTDPERIKALGLRDYKLFMPGLCADAGVPRHLVDAGVQSALCNAVVALCNDEDTNLKIAVMTRFLNPNAKIICRASSRRHQDNLIALGQVTVINPFELFAKQLSTAITQPKLHNVSEWLVGAKGEKLGDSLKVPLGSWIICGYGRMGKWMNHYLSKHDIKIILIDPDLDEDANESRSISAHADHETLKQAGLDHAVGIVASTNNDASNLNILLSANTLKPDIFSIVRQNYHENQPVFDATKASLVMQSSMISARRVLLLLISELTDIMLEQLATQPLLTEQVIKRLQAILGHNKPYLWSLNVDQKQSPVLLELLREGTSVALADLVKKPNDAHATLECLPLVLKRATQITVLPDLQTHVLKGDELLFCGTFASDIALSANLGNYYTLQYMARQVDVPRGYVFGWLAKRGN